MKIGLKCFITCWLVFFYVATFASKAVTAEAVEKFAYVTNSIISGSFKNTISICPVNLDGSLQACTTHNDPSFNGPIDIILNKQATLAYVLNDGGWGPYNPTVSVCSINKNGSFGSCSATKVPGANQGGLALHPNNKILYITGSDHFVSICPLNPNGFVEACTTKDGFDSPVGRIGLRPDGKFAYVPNYSSENISICPINPDGSLGICTTSSDLKGAPHGADVDTTGRYLYVAVIEGFTGKSFTAICPIHPDGSLGKCSYSLGNGTFDFYITNLFISNTQFAYVPNRYDDTLSICPINSDGSFGICTVHSDSFIEPTSAWISFGKNG